jgi:uncharacterized membrane protein HdeD (DUF308 family)
METKSFKNWWFLTISGIIAILFGLMILFFTKEFIQTAIFYFGLLILITGLVLLLATFYYVKKNKNISMITIQSIATIAIGLIIMVFPQRSLELFLMLIGLWCVIVGILHLVILFFIQKILVNWPVLLVNGLLTIVLGIIIFFHPFEISDVIGKLIAIFSIVFGITMIYLSFVIRKSVKKANKANQMNG